MFITACTGCTIMAAHQRVNHHPLTGIGTCFGNADRFMAQNQGRNAPFIMAMPGMHIRAANAAEMQINQRLPRFRLRGRHISDFRALRGCIHKCFHILAYPWMIVMPDYLTRFANPRFSLTLDSRLP